MDLFWFQILFYPFTLPLALRTPPLTDNPSSMTKQHEVGA